MIDANFRAPRKWASRWRATMNLNRDLRFFRLRVLGNKSLLERDAMYAGRVTWVDDEHESLPGPLKSLAP